MPVNFIGLTGEPVTQMEVAGQLHIHSSKRRASVAILCSVRAYAEVAAITAYGGEIWHVGPSPLAFPPSLIDRTLDAATPEELADQVLCAFLSFTNPTPLTGEAHHG